MIQIRSSRLSTLLAASTLLMSTAPLLRAQDPAPATPVQAAPDAQDQTYQGESPDRYAMVRALEGQVRIRKGDLEEDLTRGTPIAEGDVVESSGRGVLQLGDGSRVAFANGTRFTVANLFTSQDGKRQVLLRLDSGRLRIRMDDDRGARIRVDTASGSVVCNEHGTFSVEADSDRTVRVSSADGHLQVSNERDQVTLGAGERLTMFGAQDRLDRVREVNTYNKDDFEAWSDAAWQVRHGESWDRVPQEIRYYADDLDEHGTWVYSDEYGWVWKPSGMAEDWRPYSDGRWAAYPGGMTWVGVEPWAYTCYHHGRWAWSAGFGWGWIPGVYYSPAWVAWNYDAGYCAWAPLGYYNAPCTWGYGVWGGGYCWNVVPFGYMNVWNVRGRCIYDRGIIGRFGAPGVPGRSLTPPWRSRPLLATPGELRTGQIQRAFEPGVARDRMVAYQRSAATTGRNVMWRPGTAAGVPNGARPGSTATAPVRVPFETRRIGNNPAPDRGISRPGGQPMQTVPNRGERQAQQPDRYQPQPRRDQPERSDLRPSRDIRDQERPGRDFERDDRRPAPQPREYQPYQPRDREPRGGGNEFRGGGESRGGGGESRGSAPAPRGGGESHGSPAPSRGGGGSPARSGGGGGDHHGR